MTSKERAIVLRGIVTRVAKAEAQLKSALDVYNAQLEHNEELRCRLEQAVTSTKQLRTRVQQITCSAMLDAAHEFNNKPLVM